MTRTMVMTMTMMMLIMMMTMTMIMMVMMIMMLLMMTMMKMMIFQNYFHNRTEPTKQERGCSQELLDKSGMLKSRVLLYKDDQGYSVCQELSMLSNDAENFEHFQYHHLLLSLVEVNPSTSILSIFTPGGGKCNWTSLFSSVLLVAVGWSHVGGYGRLWPTTDGLHSLFRLLLVSRAALTMDLSSWKQRGFLAVCVTMCVYNCINMYIYIYTFLFPWCFPSHPPGCLSHLFMTCAFRTCRWSPSTSASPGTF